MHPTTPLRSPTTRCHPAWWLLALAVALAAGLLAHGAIPQWTDYHRFADTRVWLGVPNAENVFSNLPFALVGAWGLRLCARRVPSDAGRAAWAVFGVALLATAVGSALYHWAPSNAALVFDRLPIAWACAALLCAFLGERVDARWTSAPALGAALVTGSAAVAWWWFTERNGHGDLRAYLFVQFVPMLVVPAGLLLRLSPRHARALDPGAWWGVLGLYAAAKAAELADRGLLDALHVISGHTLKHLLAAAAACWLLRAVARSNPAPQLR